MNLVANLVSKIGVTSVVLGVCAIACSNTPEPEKAIIAANVQPNPANGAGCSSPEKFLYIPESASIPGPDTNNGTVQCGGNNNICTAPQACCLAKGATTPSCVAGSGACSLDGDVLITNSTATGGDVLVTCSVIPSGSGYNVSLQGQISGGTAPGTLTITGLFTPRPRDGSSKPNADQATKIPNITVDMLDATKHLNQKDCFAQYLAVDNGSPSATTALPDPADVFADDNGGRIWLSIFCPSPTNLLESQKPGNAGCMSSMTIRFENCASKAP